MNDDRTQEVGRRKLENERHAGEPRGTRAPSWRDRRRASCEVAVCPPATLIAAAVEAAAGSHGADRRAGLPCGSLGRAHRRHLGRDDRRCRRQAGDRRPFGAADRTMARPMRSSAPRPRPPGGRASSPSCASAKPKRSAAREPPTRCSTGRSPGRSRMAPPRRRWWSPMSRCGRSAPGLTPSNGDIVAAHTHIRARLAGRFGQEADAIRILYGGSVKPDNAGDHHGA